MVRAALPLRSSDTLPPVPASDPRGYGLAVRGTSAEPADGVAGPALQGLLAVAELADQVLAAIAQRRDIGVSRVVGRPGGSGEDVKLAQHRPGVAQQRRCPLDLLRRPDRIAAVIARPRPSAGPATRMRRLALRRRPFRTPRVSLSLSLSKALAIAANSAGANREAITSRIASTLA